VSFLKD